ncbi:MAG: hypothetical protein MUC60_10185 [Oscillatoria sp. Prado101]|nr:hypothetical protein [Oscillatoria sp. Prado101]
MWKGVETLKSKIERFDAGIIPGFGCAQPAKQLSPVHPKPSPLMGYGI